MSKGGGGFRLGTPLNQLRHSNISVVRYKFGGQRFEIACYKNKVMSYRQGIEKDLGEVLQVERVFTNVAKGEYATARDLVQVFGHDNEAEICVLILQKGELQVNARERQAELDNLFRDVVTIVTEKSVNADNRRRFPMATIEKSLRQIGFALKPDKPVKAQALAAIKALQERSSLNIRRAPMKLKFVSRAPVPALQELVQRSVAEGAVTVLSEMTDPDRGLVLEVLLDPHLFRDVDALTKETGIALTVIDEAFVEDTEVAIAEQEHVLRPPSALSDSENESDEDGGAPRKPPPQRSPKPKEQPPKEKKRRGRRKGSSELKEPDGEEKEGEGEEQGEEKDDDPPLPWMKKQPAPKPVPLTRKEKQKKARQQEKEEALADQLAERLKKLERRKQQIDD